MAERDSDSAGSAACPAWPVELDLVALDSAESAGVRARVSAQTAYPHLPCQESCLGPWPTQCPDSAASARVRFLLGSTASESRRQYRASGRSYATAAPP